MRLPRCEPKVEEGSGAAAADVPSPLVPFLQAIQRPSELGPAFFAALGVHVMTDCPADELIPRLGSHGDRSRPHPFLPDAEAAATYDQLFKLYSDVYFSLGTPDAEPIALGAILPELKRIAAKA